jgi:hypothetical protein
MHKLKQNHLKYLTRLLLLTILDYLLIRFWILRIDPDPSVSIGILLLVPAVFLLNIFIAIVFTFIKKQYAGLFYINTIIASILFYYIFINGINRHQHAHYETWQFNLHDTAFNITLSKRDTTFSISCSTNTSSSIEFMNRHYLANAREYILVADSKTITIKEGLLYGFDNKDSIILTKKER